MPTFQSVNLDPTVSHLFTGRRPPQAQHSKQHAAHSGNDVVEKDGDGTKDPRRYDDDKLRQQGTSTMQQPPPPLQHQRKLVVGVEIAGVSTPRAMLTRTPEDLVEVFLRNHQKDLNGNDNNIVCGSNKTDGEDDSNNGSGNFNGKTQSNEKASRKRGRPGEDTDVSKQRQLRSVLLEQMEGLRNQVAQKMIELTRTGKLFHAKSQHKDVDDHDDDDDDGGDDRNISSSRANQALIPGATFSPLETWQRISCQTLDSNAVGADRIIRTGCEALDRLLTFPNEALDLSSLEPQALPRRLGLPPGYVLQITSSSGSSSSSSYTKGKTQLALQIAAWTIKDSLLASKIPQQLQNQRQNDTALAAAGFNRRLVKVRYCYNAGGHTGTSLAKRFLELLGVAENQRRRKSKSFRDIPPTPGGDQIEFQSISQLSQLSATLARIEDDWVQTLTQKGKYAYDDSEPSTIIDPPSVLVIDGLYSIPPEQDEAQFFKIERWLKRIARQYSISVIVVGGGSSSNNNNIGGTSDGIYIADCGLNISEDSPTSIKVHLVRHPVKLVTENDWVSVEHTSTKGLVSSSRGRDVEE